jgi:nitroimidazol reductase NimA-like FMN-containing flavoprotein (pyridoxamine 5'-phosphate oxidase superfamily)
MIGKLTETQIDQLLQREVIGRIGCHSNEQVYVVPISYAFDGENIYAHSYEGLKIDMMRKRPDVCFEVDDLKDMGNWQSVIAWGKFEEVKNNEERNSALRFLLNRHLPLVPSATTNLGETWPFSADELDSIDGIVFRIRLEKKTGKFENRSTSTRQFAS